MRFELLGAFAVVRRFSGAGDERDALAKEVACTGGMDLIRGMRAQPLPPTLDGANLRGIAGETRIAAPLGRINHEILPRGDGRPGVGGRRRRE